MAKRSMFVIEGSEPVDILKLGEATATPKRKGASKLTTAPVVISGTTGIEMTPSEAAIVNASNGKGATNGKGIEMVTITTSSETKRRRGKASSEYANGIETASAEDLAAMASWGPGSTTNTAPASPAAITSLQAAKTARDTAAADAARAEINERGKAYLAEIDAKASKGRKASKPAPAAKIVAPAPVVAARKGKAATPAPAAASKAPGRLEALAIAKIAASKPSKPAPAVAATPAPKIEKPKPADRPLVVPAARGESKFLQPKYMVTGERERTPGKFVAERSVKQGLGGVTIEYLDTMVADARNTYPKGPRYVCLCSHGTTQRTNHWNSGLTVRPERWCAECAEAKTYHQTARIGANAEIRAAAKLQREAAVKATADAAAKADAKAKRDAAKAAKATPAPAAAPAASKGRKASKATPVAAPVAATRKGRASK